MGWLKYYDLGTLEWRFVQRKLGYSNTDYHSKLRRSKT